MNKHNSVHDSVELTKATEHQHAQKYHSMMTQYWGKSGHQLMLDQHVRRAAAKKKRAIKRNTRKR